MRKIYLALAIVGFLLPYYFLAPWLLEHGLDLGLFLQQIVANPGATMFTSDLVISSLVFWLWGYGEAHRLGMKNFWVYVAANLLVGLSLALPLFLYMREGRLNPSNHEAT
jgi:hypothetical protein